MDRLKYLHTVSLSLFSFPRLPSGLLKVAVVSLYSLCDTKFCTQTSRSECACLKTLWSCREINTPSLLHQPCNSSLHARNEIVRKCVTPPSPGFHLWRPRCLAVSSVDWGTADGGWAREDECPPLNHFLWLLLLWPQCVRGMPANGGRRQEKMKYTTDFSVFFCLIDRLDS